MPRTNDLLIRDLKDTLNAESSYFILNELLDAVFDGALHLTQTGDAVVLREHFLDKQLAPEMRLGGASAALSSSEALWR
jgi:hypothetical protein